VLRSEAGYLELARQFGLRAGQPILAGADAIQIARFDRTVRDGRVLRYGQESLASAADIPEFGASVPHTRYVEAIRRHTTDPTAEIVEYVLRDVLNLAAGNIDNHGRNTALQKFPDGRIALSPVFDFAPMRLVQEGPRVTRWTDIASDVEPDWTKVAEVVCADLMDPSVLLAELKERAPFVRELPARARALGIDEIVIERAMNRHDEIADTLDAIAEPRPKP
jgi:serine/threonine-protein kinase HipA